MVPEPRSDEGALRRKFMLIFRGGAVARRDLSPSELQAHVEKWYRWSDELARQGRGNAGTALGSPGAAVRGHERMVTDGPYAESKVVVLICDRDVTGGGIEVEFFGEKARMVGGPAALAAQTG